MTALLKRAGKKESRKRAFVAAVEAVMGAGEESRQEALLLWDQAKADKERTKELEAYWKSGSKKWRRRRSCARLSVLGAVAAQSARHAPDT